MADYSINISNSVRVFGVEESTKWGQSIGVPYTMTWGTSLWGYGYTTVVRMDKVLSNSITPTWDYSSSELRKVFEIGSVTLDFETSSEGLKNGVWNYVFSSDTTEAENRDFPTYTSGSASAVSFTCASVGSTTWT